MYQNWYLQRMDQESTDGKVLICRRDSFRAQAGSEMAVDGQRVNRWFRSCPFPLPHPLPSCPFSFPSPPSPLPSLPFPLPLLPLPPKWIRFPKMVEFFGRSFWAEVLGGNFLPENVAQKRCPENFKRVESLAPKCAPKLPQNWNINVLPYVWFFGRALKKTPWTKWGAFWGGLLRAMLSLWAEFLGGVILPENVARKCCPKTFDWITSWIWVWEFARRWRRLEIWKFWNVVNFEAWVVKLRWPWDALRKDVLRDGAAAWMVFAKQIRKEKESPRV